MIQLRWMTPATQYLPGSLECQESCGSGRLDRAVGIARIALLPCLLVLISLPAPASNTITGTVRNQTSGLPAASDKIVLLRIDHGMIEEAQTTTDGQGSFSLAVQFPNKPHVVRAIYKSVVYDQRVTSDAPLAIGVFDSASKVAGLTGNAEIIRVSSKGSSLHVSDMFDVDNRSNPPITEASDHTVAIHLDPDAKIDTVLAAGPGTIGTIISALPVQGTSGAYRLDFPLRPGVTKFAVNYDLPYSGKAVFHPVLQYPVQQFAVMFPPAMKFTSSAAGFHPLATGDRGFQVQAMNRVRAGALPSFELSGNGTLPAAPDQARSKSITPAAQIEIPATAAGTPITGKMSNPQPTKATLWIVAMFAILASAWIIIWRIRRSVPFAFATASLPNSVPSAVADGPSSAATTLEAIKEQLFRLEADRLRGSISAADYATSKQALEKIIGNQLGYTQM